MTKKYSVFPQKQQKKKTGQKDPMPIFQLHQYPNNDLEWKILQNSVENFRGWIQYNSAYLVVLWTLGPLFIARTIDPYVQVTYSPSSRPVPVIFVRFNET